MLASGGDRRIVVPRGGNTNAYGASPFPRSTLAYAASTANDISLPAFAHLKAMVESWSSGDLMDARTYRTMLETYRQRIRAAWGIGDDVEVVFAPSGTDLEYVALALAAARSGLPVTNILLGQDEVGSGCILSAAGRYFAQDTALCPRTTRGEPLDGLEDAEVVALPLRDADGTACDCDAVSRMIDATASAALAAGRHPLTHVVHGSKTGLILPGPDGMDRLQRKHGSRLSWVVDACQARLDSAAIRAYLRRDAIVMLTGSKFIGGPPFSGFALVPRAFRPPARLAAGLAAIFRRAEWPLGWTACDHLPDAPNPGLQLRLEAALFELERFGAVAAEARARVIAGFGTALQVLADRLGADPVSPPVPAGASHGPTVGMLDLTPLSGAPDFAMAQRWHRVLAARGLRLGQPVRCQRRADGQWSGNLRISLSMPLIVSLSDCDEAQLASRFSRDMAQIAEVLEAAQRPIVA